jgi:Zn-dependent metalloprotease
MNRSLLIALLACLGVSYTIAQAAPLVVVQSSSSSFRAEVGATPESSARQFLSESAGGLGLRSDLADLKLESVTETPGGFVVRFRQVSGGFQMDRAGIVVSLSKDLEPLTYINNAVPVSQTRGLHSMSVQLFKLNEADALKIAYRELKLSASPVKQDLVKRVRVENGVLRPVYQIQLSAPVDHRYAWEMVIDAETGRIYRSVNLIVNHQSRDRVSVATQVLDPNPTIKSGHALGQVAGYADNSNGNSSFFDSMMTPVTLDNLTPKGNKFILSGPNVQISDSESPKNPECAFGVDGFKLRRNDPCFDAVNVYYFLDKEIKYLNGPLGFKLHPLKYSGGIKADPHGLDGQDNSHYSPYSDELAFGEGGVDDAQDHDVIIHEMGHAIHNWVTGGHLSQVEGLSEGSGDYWAASYDRQFMKPGHIAYNWTFSFDGHNEFWPGRVLNVTKNYPAGAQGEVHDAGQLWAAVCMDIYDAIGKQKADQLFWTALSNLDENSSQADAAKAYVVATQKLFPSDLETVIKKFKARGYPVQ